jgi:deoxycytidine triphosphate deaminase
MSIKADHWIRKMAREQGMIEPFVEGQVRDGVISYGLSSYGYDMRVSDEFKVFTNVFNVIVDPKNFSPRSFVDIKADYCDIPPNSFALARSVEYFRIPRSTTCIVLGKSTYARCFCGDTQVALVDGTSVALEDMARRAENGELFWGYSVGPHGRIIVTLLDQPRYIGRDALLEIELDNGAMIHCTPDHEFMLRDGQMRAAGELSPGSSLMPLYRDVFRGYEGVFQPLTGTYTPTHRLADEWNIRNGIYADAPGTHRHHIDHQRRNNMPELLNCDRSVFRRFPDAIKNFRGNKTNHRITAIRSLAGDHDVYCLTVPETGNFALEAGAFVSNCGIIVNITPLEPEWEGFVTIEISNTTPLPARIYANEGIGQVLFLESDAPCEQSYRDKKGKYQSQVGIVLPKIDGEQQ